MHNPKLPNIQMVLLPTVFPIVVCVHSAYVISAGIGFRVESGQWHFFSLISEDIHCTSWTLFPFQLLILWVISGCGFVIVLPSHQPFGTQVYIWVDIITKVSTSTSTLLHKQLTMWQLSKHPHSRTLIT